MRGSLNRCSRPAASRNALYSLSVVCENCIQRPSAESATRRRNASGWLGTMRSPTSVMCDAPANASGYCCAMRRIIQFHVSWAEWPWTRVVSTRWPRPLVSRSYSAARMPCSTSCAALNEQYGARHERRSRSGRDRARGVERAELGEHHSVIRGKIGVRAAAGEAGDRPVHEAGVVGRQVVVAEATLLGHAGSPRLEEHVGRAYQRAERVAVAVVVEVEHDALLAATPGRPRGLGAQDAAAGGLDQRHVGAEVGQQLRRLRARQRLGHVDDPQAFQWLRGQWLRGRHRESPWSRPVPVVSRWA